MQRNKIKTNKGARPGDLLYSTKPLRIGLLSTAEKHGTIRDEDLGKAAAAMFQLNNAGVKLAEIPGVHALTGVTGFGILGHLAVICEVSGVQAELNFSALRFLTDLSWYVASGALAKGLKENWMFYTNLRLWLIESEGTCHCTFFGRGDLDDAGFREAEARLMREYRVELSYRKNMLCTAAIPTDPYQGTESTGFISS